MSPSLKKLARKKALHKLNYEGFKKTALSILPQNCSKSILQSQQGFQCPLFEKLAHKKALHKLNYEGFKKTALSTLLQK